ncbi:hypothetical protein GPL20_04655 [Bradyrhizobium cajani]|uniref:Uncharacterized protein n=1 Tax=Bradyrhizobium cajani TaxID=1928661 RepID=A0A844SZS3_9BRAD|nr:hypothetical protein [Bradyrhizobium cajani]
MRGSRPRVELLDLRKVLSTSSLRAQRSNPESFRGGILDCFAALAMTRREWASTSLTPASESGAFVS